MVDHQVPRDGYGNLVAFGSSTAQIANEMRKPSFNTDSEEVSMAEKCSTAIPVL